MRQISDRQIDRQIDVAVSLSHQHKKKDVVACLHKLSSVKDNAREERDTQEIVSAVRSVGL